MPNPTYKTFFIQVTAADKGRLLPLERTTFELDTNVATVTGISLNADNRGTLFGYGSQRVELSGKEIFPEGYPSHMLMSGVTTAPNQKYYRFAEPLVPGTRKLLVQFTDKWTPPAAGLPDDWQPYVVQVLIEQSIR